MNVRGVLLLALIGMVLVSGVVAVVYIRHLSFITAEGVELRRWAALWSAWPIYLAFGLIIALAFALVQSWGLEAAFDEDKTRWQGRLDAEAEQAKNKLEVERESLRKERSELSTTRYQLEAAEHRAEVQAEISAERSLAAEKKMMAAEQVVAEIKEKMRHKEGYQRRYKTKLARLGDE